jgi:hypothetical protein
MNESAAGFVAVPFGLAPLRPSPSMKTVNERNITMQSAVMAAAQHGAKHICSDCAVKYYDLGKKNALCPKCGGQPVPDSLPSSGRPAKRSSRATFRQ